MKIEHFKDGLTILQVCSREKELQLVAEHDQIFIANVEVENVTDYLKQKLFDLGFSYNETDGWYCFV